MKRRYHQYMTELEDEDQLAEDFEALIVDDIDNLDQPEKPPNSTYFTSCGKVNLN